MRSLLLTLPLTSGALLLFSVALIHALAPDNHIALATLHAGTGWWLLPAYPLALVALLLQRRRSALVYVAVAVAHFAWVTPGHLPPLRPPEGPLYRIGSANLFALNPTPERLQRELLRLDASVWCLQELTPEWASRLSRPAVVARWPHRALHPDDSAFGIGLMSKRPFEGVEVIDIQGVPMLLATADGITVACAHPEPPRTVRIAQRWHRQITALGEVLSEVDGPLVLAGDLNATRHHPSFVSLAEISGLHDAHADAGRASALSWPAPPYFFGVPLLRLDHILLSDDLRALDAIEGAASGSDHRPIVVSFVRNM